MNNERGGPPDFQKIRNRGPCFSKDTVLPGQPVAKSFGGDPFKFPNHQACTVARIERDCTAELRKQLARSTEPWVKANVSELGRFRSQTQGQGCHRARKNEHRGVLIGGLDGHSLF
jgi:hypothetical protein